MRPYLLALVATISFGAANADAKEPSARLGDVLSAPIRIERAAAVSQIPITLRSGKVHLEATIGEFSGGFIFDTGSPTILDKALAEQLKLEVIGENTGRDANGNSVLMAIAIAPSIAIGDVVFYDVPVMVHDFAKLPTGKCYIPNGVIGSELLPGSAWRLNSAAATLKIASSIDELPTLDDTHSAPMNLFGYPYSPIVDYRIGRFEDKALFDTGNSAEVALFSQIAKDKFVSKRIDPDTLEQGQGQLGTSAGGLGDVVPLSKFQLRSLSIGNNNLGRTQVHTRPFPPTLIGAGILATHTVTLDYPNEQFLMSIHPAREKPKPDAGFILAVTANQVEVMQIFEASAAKTAGLSLGDKVIAIDDVELSVSTAEHRCEVSLWLSNEFNASAVKTLTIERNGEQLTLKLTDSKTKKR